MVRLCGTSTVVLLNCDRTGVRRCTHRKSAGWIIADDLSPHTSPLTLIREIVGPVRPVMSRCDKLP